MIDLQLPADEYLDMEETGDTDEVTTICNPYQRGGDDDSCQRNSSGSCLDVNNSNGLADLNEPLVSLDSEPVALSRDMYSHYGRSSLDVQGQWLEKSKRQNGWIFEAGHDRNTQIDQQHLPSHSVQVLSNNAFQPRSYPTIDHSKVKFFEERAKIHQASYDSYVESSAASNAPRLHYDNRRDFVRPPWSHWSSSSSWENPMSTSHQKPYPVQTNPFMNFVAHGKPDSSFEMRSRVSNGIYQGFSSGSKEESVFNLPSAGYKPNASVGEVVKHPSFQSLQGSKGQECSAGLPWLKPKPLYKSEMSSGLLDLNAPTNQFGDESDMGGGVSCLYPQKSLKSGSCSNNANMQRVEVINTQSNRKNLGCPIFEKHSNCKDGHKERNHSVKQDLDINLPCDASVSIEQHGGMAICVEKEQARKASNLRHLIDLNSCATEDDEDSGLHSGLRMKRKTTAWIDLEAPPTLESEEEEEEVAEAERLQEKTKDESWGSTKGQDGVSELIKVAADAIVAISLSDHQRHPDDAASSSTDGAANSLLSWFADIITSRGNELGRKADVSTEAAGCEGYREEYSSGEIDYLEAMTLNLQQMKEEDYMPKPLVPENLKFEGPGINQPRRGQARRGRPKRDFQRDILPGLPSLLRHEITEDIQMFGVIMKTRDNTCNSGVAARRNSKRKRLLTNINQPLVCPSVARPTNEGASKAGLEESKLTGWGKATRRPRRQRCPHAAAGYPTITIQ